MTNCYHCDNPAEYWTCCGNPSDGSSGTGCGHDDGTQVCDACWTRLEAAGELSASGMSWAAHDGHRLVARGSLDVYCDTCSRYLTGDEMDDPVPVDDGGESRRS